MAGSINTFTANKFRISEQEGYPTASSRFDWTAAILAALIGGGLYLDGWAHNHGKVDSTFFTPWHAVLYGAMALTGLYLFQFMVRSRLQGFPWQRALPKGYPLSALGVVLFVIGGMGDLVWHTLFGFEANLEALLSPTHLILALAGTLILSGPLRAVGQKHGRLAYGWAELGPMVLSSALVLAIFEFFTEFANPLVNPIAAGNQPNASFSVQSLGVASILIQAILFTGLILFLVRRWTLPFGALTCILALNAILISVLRDQYQFIPGVFAAGLVTDLMLLWVRPSIRQPTRYWAFSFLTPVVFFTFYFVSLLLWRGIAWSIHLWAGSIVMAGVAGLVLGFMFVPPPSLASEP